MRPPPTPRSVPARGAFPAGTHVVLAGDEALLEAQEGNVADEVVPHGSAARGTLSSGVLRGWDLNWLERGSRLCRGGRWGGGGKRGQGACREGSASSFVFGIPGAPVAGGGWPHARRCARTLAPVLPVASRTPVGCRTPRSLLLAPCASGLGFCYGNSPTTCTSGPLHAQFHLAHLWQA